MRLDLLLSRADGLAQVLADSARPPTSRRPYASGPLARPRGSRPPTLWIGERVLDLIASHQPCYKRHDSAPFSYAERAQRPLTLTPTGRRKPVPPVTPTQDRAARASSRRSSRV
jgi:hypothetical protein